MAKKTDLIEPIDAAFEDVVNAIATKVKVIPTPNKKIGSTMKLKIGTPVSQDLVWAKKLSKTDAQQETTGGIVPYLRLTKSSLSEKEDFQTWFRDKFFAGQPWVPGSYGRETNIETCKVIIDVTFKGVSLSGIAFELTHGPHRWESNNAPNTWIHWPHKLQELLQNNDLSDEPITLTRHANGQFSMRLGR